MPNMYWAWGGFLIFILFMLALDLGLVRRKTHTIGIKEALIWSAIWIALALVFDAGIWIYGGEHRKKLALEFFTGYVLEKSLSVDNLFVFIVIFHYFKVPPAYQHKILFWGVMGALIMRAFFIFAGVLLIKKFSWLMYLFGGVLIITGLKMFKSGDDDIEPEKNPVLRLFKRVMPVTHEYHGSDFLTRIGGRLTATPMMVVLVIVETTDLIFAVDSIPAVIGITQDPFIIFTSNVFAILGLRSLYFALAGIMQLFHYLKIGLAFILVFIGVKMVLKEGWHYEIPIQWALGVVGGVLALSVIMSLILKPAAKEVLPPAPAEPVQDSTPEHPEPEPKDASQK